jgi:mannan endo-1,4-beta-mannosidase
MQSSKITNILLSSILVLGVVGVMTILSGGKFAYAISDPISSPVDPSPSPIISEPITPSPSPVISPSPEISPSPDVSPSPIASPSPLVSPSPVISPSPVVSPSPVQSPSPSVVPSVSPSVSAAPSPTPAAQFKAEFFNNEKVKGNPVFETTVSEINFDWGKSSPDSSVRKDGFSARFKGMKYFAGGRYKVTTSNDDGLKFYLDGSLVHSAWYDQGALKRSFKMDIPQGNHWVVVDYYDAGGKASAMISWEKLQ